MQTSPERDKQCWHGATLACGQESDQNDETHFLKMRSKKEWTSQVCCKSKARGGWFWPNLLDMIYHQSSSQQIAAGTVVLESVIISSVEEYCMVWLNDRFIVHCKRDSRFFLFQYLVDLQMQLHLNTSLLDLRHDTYPCPALQELLIST